MGLLTIVGMFAVAWCAIVTFAVVLVAMAARADRGAERLRSTTATATPPRQGPARPWRQRTGAARADRPARTGVRTAIH